MRHSCDRIWVNARLYSRHRDRSMSGDIVAARDGIIIYAGPEWGAPELDPVETVDCQGRWITPGLIDCHTHLVYGGNRAPEFAQRLAGASYEEIARAGGGILSTMRATRTASEEELLASALRRLDRLIDEGVTTIEVKSGYGLTREDEAKLLRVARRLGEARAILVRTTLLGAHAVPPEYAGHADDYVAMICDQMIPEIAAAGLADAVDAFCEHIAFSPEQVARVFAAARQAGLPVKLHADQLSNGQGGRLAAHNGALSADHLEHLDPAGVRAMADAGTVAVLLPGAYYFTRETKLPPIQALRDAGVPIALATDCNPGTSPLTSLLLAMNMAATLFRLTVDECLAAVTGNAARALGLSAVTGAIEAGKWCDLAIWDIDDPAELVYNIGDNPLYRRIWRGQ